MGSRSGGVTRVALFTDHDPAGITGAATTLKAVLRHSRADVVPRIYAASQVRWPRLNALADHLRADQVDVIHIASAGPVGLAGRVLSRYLGIAAVGSTDAAGIATPFGDTVVDALLERYKRWLYSCCDPLLAPSAMARDKLIAAGHRPRRLQTWPRGVDSEQFSPARRSDFMRRMWGGDRLRPAILYVGRLSREQGLAVLPAIQRQLVAWRMHHQLVLVGDGPMRDELRSICPDALFLGTLAHDDVRMAMASADVLLYPGARCSGAHVVLEAQASGLPVVVSDRGAAREDMVDGRTGLIARHGHGEFFADRIAAILRHDETRAAMGQNARALALTCRWDAALEPLREAWQMAAVRTAALATSRAVPDRDAVRAPTL